MNLTEIKRFNHNSFVRLIQLKYTFSRRVGGSRYAKEVEKEASAEDAAKTPSES